MEQMTEQRPDWLNRLSCDRRIWIIVGTVLAVALFWVAFFLFSRTSTPEQGERLVARVTVGGVQVLAIDLYKNGLIECAAGFPEQEIEKKRKDLYFDLGSVGVGAVLRLKNDRQICVDHSDCGDQACVKCGYIEKLDQTIECEEDGLRVEIIEKTVL